MLQPFYVISPEYTTYPASDYSGPEYGCDAVEVEARTKREAIVLGVRKIMAEGHRSHAQHNRDNGSPPFAGYRAELARCGHGNPHFVMVGDTAVPVRCWACDEQHRRSEASA